MVSCGLTAAWCQDLTLSMTGKESVSLKRPDSLPVKAFSNVPTDRYIVSLIRDETLTMNRRETIKAIMAASGTLVALPHWAAGWSVNDLARHPSSFTSVAEGILAAVTDTIIPAGDSIGALSVGVDKFLRKLIDDCYEKDVQDNVKAQLERLENSAREQYGKGFDACHQTQREAMLLKLPSSGDKAQEDFFKLIKAETIRGFNTSREVMVNYHRFKQVPGHYYGCVDVNA